MALFSAAQHEAMLKATGGEVVKDTASGVKTYGHYERVPMEVGEEYSGVLTTKPSVVIADGSVSAIGPRTGIGRTLTIGSNTWTIADILPGDEDGGLLRLMLSED